MIRRRSTHLLFCPLFALLLVQGCRGADKVDSYAPVGEPAACSSNVDVCAEVTPRVEVTVKDESGQPVQFAMVNNYYPDLSLSKLDPDRYPETDGFGRKKSYFTCTNEAGIAILCGWDGLAAFAGATVDVWRSGYLPASYSFDLSATPPLGDGVVRTLDFTLTAAPSSDQTSKVLFLPCYTGDESRLANALVFERVAFTIPEFGHAVDALMADSEQPLGAFDTLVLDAGCSWYEPYEEFLVPEKNEKLWRWIEAGGRVLFSEPSNTGWDMSDPACTREPCSNAFFPEAYRFALIPKNRGTTDGAEACTRFQHGTVVEPSHPLVQGVSFDDWSYMEYRQNSDVKTNVTWNATWKSTVDTSLWKILLTASSSEAEVNSKPGCWQNDPTLARTNAAAALMETQYGAGRVVFSNAAWIQATNGERVGTGQLYAEDAAVLKNNIIQFVTQL